MIVNKLLYRISLNKARSWIMVFNCNINAFSNLISIIYLYNENMNLEMTIKKLGSAYKFRVGRATGNEHIFLFGLIFKLSLKYTKLAHLFRNEKTMCVTCVEFTWCHVSSFVMFFMKLYWLACSPMFSVAFGIILMRKHHVCLNSHL